MKDATRKQLIALARQAGCSTSLIAEIQDGCNAERAGRMFQRELDSCEPGTLVLKDPDAAGKAISLCLAAMPSAKAIQLGDYVEILPQRELECGTKVGGYVIDWVRLGNMYTVDVLGTPHAVTGSRLRKTG